MTRSMKKTLKQDALSKAKALNLKKQSLKKDPLQKGKPKTGPGKKPATKTSGGKTKSLKKDKGLTKEKLDQLGSLSLDEKIRAVAENAETEEEAASALQQSMTKAEKNKCWSKHNTHLKNHPDEKKALEKATKTEKGLASALFLLRKEGKKYLSVKSKVSAEETLQKTEEWETEKEMLQKFTDQEFQRHLASGRVVWRQDPTTWDCYEYCDTKKFKKTVNVGRKKQWEEGQEYEPTAEESASYSGLYNQAMGLQGDALASLDSLGKGFDLAKGKGKGKGKETGTGKGRGKGKGKTTGQGKAQLAIKDGQVESQEEEEEEPEETEKETLKKVKKARDACTSALSNLELALHKAQDQLSAKGKSSAEVLQDELRSHLSQLKEVLLSKAMDKEQLKNTLQEVAASVKAGNKECKELNQLANKAESVAASRVSKKSKKG